MSEPKLRKATLYDLTEVTELFCAAIDYMNSNNIPQWDNIYPNKEVLSNDILKEQLYVLEIDGKIISVGVINQEFDKGYADGKWQFNNSDFAVLHRLCVSPDYQNMGIGKKTAVLLEELMKELGYSSVRLDAFSLNPYALKMYEKLGYKKVGETNFRKGLFYLYEKSLN